MRWSRIVALGLCLGWTGACSSGQPSVDITKDKAAIDTTRDAYVSAWRSGNAADVTGLYADDALVLYPNRPPIVGKAAIQTYFNQFFGDFGQNEFELTLLRSKSQGRGRSIGARIALEAHRKPAAPPSRITGSTS
jgi:hypothetical protein